MKLRQAVPKSPTSRELDIVDYIGIAKKLAALLVIAVLFRRQLAHVARTSRKAFFKCLVAGLGAYVLFIVMGVVLGLNRSLGGVKAAGLMLAALKIITLPVLSAIIVGLVSGNSEESPVLPTVLLGTGVYLANLFGPAVIGELVYRSGFYCLGAIFISLIFPTGAGAGAQLAGNLSPLAPGNEER